MQPSFKQDKTIYSHEDLDTPSGSNLILCLKAAVDQLTPYMAITAYGECTLGNKMTDFVPEAVNINSTKTYDGRCSAPCTGGRNAALLK